MAISKSAKIEAEIEKVKTKITEQQARLKELEQKKVEAENSEIVDIVRGMSIPLAELPVVLQQLRAVYLYLNVFKCMVHAVAGASGITVNASVAAPPVEIHPIPGRQYGFGFYFMHFCVPLPDVTTL